MQRGEGAQSCSSLLGISTVVHGLRVIRAVKAFLAPGPQLLACRPQWAVAEASRRQAVPHSTAAGSHAGGNAPAVVQAGLAIGNISIVV